MIEVENINNKELLELCSKASRKLSYLQDKGLSKGFHRLLLINPRDSDFEAVFRIGIADFCKNEDVLFFISLRGIFELYSHSYKKRYYGEFPPSKKKDKFSKKYRNAQNKIKELFEKHYTPSNEYELLEVKKMFEMIETTISSLEITEGKLRKKATREASDYLSTLGLPKTSIEKILTFFRKLIDQQNN